MLKYDQGKYGSQKAIYKGDKYDSKKEKEYAQILDGLLADKKILYWKRQVTFPLPSMGTIMTGKRRARYVADFIVTTIDGAEHIVEIKGYFTQEMKTKYAFFEHVHQKLVHIVSTSGLNAMNTDWLNCKFCKGGNK